MVITTVLLSPHLYEWWSNTNHQPVDIYPGLIKVDAPPGYCFKLCDMVYRGRRPALFMVPKRGDIFLSGDGKALRANRDHNSPRFILLPFSSVSSVNGDLECRVDVKDIYKKDSIDIPSGYAFDSFSLGPMTNKPSYYYLDTKEVVREADNTIGLIPKIWLTKLPEPQVCGICDGKGYLFDFVNIQVLLCNGCGMFRSPEDAKQAFINDLK